MNNDVLQQADEYTKKHRWKKRWMNVVICLAAIVAFCTVCTLIMPASTLDNDNNDISENGNIENCEATPSEPSYTVFPAAGQTFTLMSPGGENADSWGVESYLDDAKPPKLYYSTDLGTTWLDTEGATDIPGNADFKLVINYKDVPIDTLLENNAEISYTLPSLLRNAKSMGDIISDGNSVGRVIVEDATVILSFDEEWLNSHIMSNVIYGEFNVQAEADLSNIENNTPVEITVGDCIITVDFEDDVIAKYGDVEISKTVSTILEEDNGDYLTYTLTVTAGEYGCPDAKVVDKFANTQYIKEYMGVTGMDTATNITDEETGVPKETSTLDVFQAGTVRLDPAPTDTTPGTLVWTIGDMDANETRTLTYKVKLTDTYTGVAAKAPLINAVNLFSMSYQRDSDTATFTPTAKANIKKTCMNFTPNENGVCGTITYSVIVTADANNSYVLDNVKIVDALDRSVNSQSYTNDALRPYLNYIEDSFELYNDEGTTECSESSGPIFTDTDMDGKNNDSFTYYVGSLAPGEIKTLTYTVNVEPGVFMAAGNENVRINNRAFIYTDDSRTDGGTQLNGYNAGKTITRKAWNRKIVGTSQETETTVSMNSNVYDATGSSVTQITSPDSSFTVPAGSYKYQVVVNEAGDWDLSSASMADSLGSQYMQFVGYVRVDAYTISSNAPGSGLGDAEAIANLSARTPAQTVWVNVDGQTYFSFTPENIGLEGNQAYLLTYYAQPVNTDNITQVMVKNTFTLSGNVVIGNSTYQIIDGIKVSVSVLVEGSNSFTAEKQSWYYEPPKVTTGDFAKGALYWVIKVDGNLLPAGIAIRDVTNAAGGQIHRIRSASFVGVYTANFGTTSLTDYADLDSLIASNTLTALDESSYSITQDYNSLKLLLNGEVELTDGKSMYIILKTDPNVVPDAKRDCFTFNNKLQSSSDGTNWIDHNVASKTLYGSENIFKELCKTFTYDGSIITKHEVDRDGIIIETELNEPGHYAAWAVKVNYEGNLSGRYRVVDTIPEGMELAYARIKWRGKSARISPGAEMVQITNLDAGWTEHTMKANMDGESQLTTSYYYTSADGTQVCWEVDNLVSGKQSDVYSVDFQVVCRVTDTDVLLGGVEKEFINTVSLQQPDGTVINQDSCGAPVKGQTLIKESTYKPEYGGRYLFKITLNEIGEDLVKGTDTVTLVDTLSDTLILDADTISVTNTVTNVEITDWTASYDNADRVLKIVLPDNLPLTITYSTTVNAAPETVVSISNCAHWYGYTAPESGIVSVENFRYSTGAIVGAVAPPTVTVQKRDQNNTGLALPGAEFTLEEGTYSDGTFTKADGGLSLSGTTDSDGNLTFGKIISQTIKYNSVYCLTETKAPDGYVLDSTPHYFTIAKQDDDGNYPTFPDGVTVWYLSADYIYQAYNRNVGEAIVEKAFQDANGNVLSKINGTYRFGLYADANPTGDPLQIVSITYANSTVTPEGGTAKFTNLTLGNTYYIYELNDSGRPIQNGSLATMNGMIFAVTYLNGPEVIVPSDGTLPATVTVTNQVHYPELPLTGGMGTTILYVLGGIFVLAAVVLLVSKRRMSKNT